MDYRRLGFRFDKDWAINEINAFHDKYTKSITIPVQVEIDVQHRVYNFGQVEQYLRRAETIVLQDCSCRLEQNHCDNPNHVCILLDENAEQRLKEPNKNSGQVSVDEALNVLRQAHDAGLVLMAYQQADEEYPKTICNCCTCCCAALSGALRFGLENYVLTRTMVAVQNNDLCIDCGMCVTRCQFNARSMENGELWYDPEHCYGCGLCSSVCPTNAITLARL